MERKGAKFSARVVTWKDVSERAGVAARTVERKRESNCCALDAHTKLIIFLRPLCVLLGWGGMVASENYLCNCPDLRKQSSGSYGDSFLMS